MNQVPNQGILSRGIPVRSVPQRRAPLAVTLSAPKVADTFGAGDEEKLAKAMGVSAPKIGGPTIKDKVIAQLRNGPASMEDLITKAGKCHNRDSVKQTVHRLARQGHISATSPHGIAIYRADPSVKIATQAQIAKERRMETWRVFLRAAHSFGRPVTIKEIAESLAKRRDWTGQQLCALEAEGMVSVRKTVVNVAHVYTVTPAGLAFMEGKSE